MSLSLPTLEVDLGEINLHDLAKSAQEAKGAHSEILRLREVLFDQMVPHPHQENEVTDKDIREVFDTLMETASESLDIGPKIIPNRIRTERNQYATDIRSVIDRRDDMQTYDLEWMIPQASIVVGHTIDYLSGIIFTNNILKGYPDRATIEKNILELRNDVIHTVQYYIYSYELERFRELKSVKGVEPFKVFGRGQTPKSHGYLRPLVYGLHDVSQPKLQSLGRTPEELVDAARYVARGLFEYSNLKAKLSNKVRLKVLIDEPEVRALITESIKPTTILDLIPGHPNLLKLRNMVEQDKELAERVIMIANLYLLKRGHGSYCSQAEISDILYDVVLGYERHKHIPFNLVFTAFGYNPLPIIGTTEYTTDITWNTRPKFLTEDQFLRTTFEDLMNPPPKAVYG